MQEFFDKFSDIVGLLEGWAKTREELLVQLY